MKSNAREMNGSSPSVCAEQLHTVDAILPVKPPVCLLVTILAPKASSTIPSFDCALMVWLKFKTFQHPTHLQLTIDLWG